MSINLADGKFSNSRLSFLSDEIEIEPFIQGGGQERQRRGGTENVPGIVVPRNFLWEHVEPAYIVLRYRMEQTNTSVKYCIPATGTVRRGVPFSGHVAPY